MKKTDTEFLRKYYTYKNTSFDLSAMVRLRHTCDPVSCRTILSCCSTYEICLTRREVDRAAGAMSLAAEFAPDLCPDGACENIFEPLEDGGYTVDTDYSGLCAFAFRDRDHTIKCSLHAAARKHHLPVTEIKPRCCIMWPLAILEGDPPVVTVHDDAYRFPCNQRRKPGCKTLHRGIAEIIEQLFGNDTLRAINARLGEDYD